MDGSIPHGLYRVIDVVRNTARQLIGAEGVTFVL
jgi:hypothetical protein